MAINIYSLNAYVLGTGGNIEALAGTSVNMTSWDQGTYQWSDDTNGVGNFSQIQDLDTVGIGDDATMTPPAQEGVLVNGTLVQVETFVGFNDSVITFADGGSINLNLSGIELADGTMLLQFSDTQIAALQAAGYDRKDITGITLGTSEYIRTRAAQNFNSPFAFCFTNGTTILTDNGMCAVEDLRPGDRVTAMNDELRTVIWVGRSRFDSADLASNRALLPICIRASALAPDVPDRDLIVSRQHRIYIESVIANRMFGSPGVLIAAKDLLDHPDVHQMQLGECGEGINYIHVLLDRHDIMIANGAPAESLLLAEHALEAVGPAARAELQDFLKQTEVLKAASQIVRGKAARDLVARHLQNDKPLLAAF